MNNNNFPYSDFYGGSSSSYAAASSSSFSLSLIGRGGTQYSAAAAASTAYSDSDDDNLMPWENHGWVPWTKSGKQKTPNMVNSYFFLHMTHDTSLLMHTASYAIANMVFISTMHHTTPDSYYICLLILLKYLLD